jgi:cytochrome c peroxidase
MRTLKPFSLIALCIPATIACAEAISVSSSLLNEPIRPLPQSMSLDEKKVLLGQKIFFDKRLSRDNKISCASCHDFSKGGADPRQYSLGVDGRVGPINSPSVFNTVFNFRQLWNGKAQSLEDQVEMVIQNPVVFDTTWQEILNKLSKDKALVQDFNKVYTDGLQSKNIVDAVSMFERSLVTPSRFDAYLRGNPDAITSEEKQGYKKFKDYGCIACHQGINVGGNMFQVFGVMSDVRNRKTPPSEADLGRYTVTKKERDKYVFKVPSLRNVALTAPYFHDGSAATLEDALDVMFIYQLGRKASNEDKTLIIKFLNTLTGKPPKTMPVEQKK